MDLREFLFFNRLSVSDFCEKVDCCRSHLSLIVNKKRKPGRRLARDIEKETNGQVTFEELMRGESQNSGKKTT